MSNIEPIHCDGSCMYQETKPEDMYRIVKSLFMHNKITNISYNELMQDFRKKWPDWEKENL